MNYDVTKSCAFSGHRILSKDFDIKKLTILIETAVKEGYKNFFVGMALGFDTVVFDILLKFKKEYDINIIACIPCVSQPEKFSSLQKIKYYKMLENCDLKILISEEYFRGCMQKRNRFMVDNSDLIIAYLNQNKGGTYSTVKYAEKQQKKVIIL